MFYNASILLKPPFPFPPLFVPPDNSRIEISSLTYIEDFKIGVSLTVWRTKGGRSPTAVRQTVKHTLRSNNFSDAI